MGRPKGAKNKKASPKDPMVEEIIEQEIEFICPVRGKVKQKVKIKRLKKPTAITVNPAVVSNDEISKIDGRDELESYDEIENIED